MHATGDKKWEIAALDRARRSAIDAKEIVADVLRGKHPNGGDYDLSPVGRTYLQVMHTARRLYEHSESEAVGKALLNLFPLGSLHGPEWAEYRLLFQIQHGQRLLKRIYAKGYPLVEIEGVMAKLSQWLVSNRARPTDDELKLLSSMLESWQEELRLLSVELEEELSRSEPTVRSA